MSICAFQKVPPALHAPARAALSSPRFYVGDCILPHIGIYKGRRDHMILCPLPAATRCLIVIRRVCQWHVSLAFLPPRRRSSCGSKMSQTALQRLPLSVREDICRQLIEPGKNIHYTDLRIGCGTLAALARTCKLFHGPSLTVLWHSIPDIYVLFYSLPSTCYQIQVINADRPQVVSLISTIPRSCRAC